MPLPTISFLIVDDHPISRSIAVEALRAVGVTRLKVAEDGGVAFGLLQTEVPDIAIVDVNMPIDGMHLLKMVRRSPSSPVPMLPMNMLTAYTDQRRILALRDAGATEVVSKPVSIATLFRRIASTIDNPLPFIHSDTFVGPDRRRRSDARYQGPRRRSSDFDSYEIDVA